MCPSKALKIRKSYSPERLQTLMRLMASGKAHAVPKAIDVLAGGLWFETLRGHTHQATAYALGKQVQPDTYQPRTEGRWPQHHNVWVKYARGLHLPGPGTVRAAARVLPTSGDILQSAVWKILNTSQPIGCTGDGLLRGLRLGVQQAVFKPRPLQNGQYIRRSAPRLPLQLLEGQADEDGVAALVVLLREAFESGNRSRAFEVGRSLHNALVIAASSIPLCDIAPELIEFFIREIFPMASDDEVAFDLDRSVLYEQTRLFSRMLLRLEDLGRIKSVCGGSEWRRVLSFDFGFDLFFGLGPCWKLVRRAEDSSAEARQFVGAGRIGRDWGLAALRSGREQRLIPDAIAAQMAAIR